MEQRTQLGVRGNGDAKGAKLGVMEMRKEAQEDNVYMIKRHRKAESERNKKKGKYYYKWKQGRILMGSGFRSSIDPEVWQGVMRRQYEGQGWGLMTSEFECKTKVLGISEILWK